MFSKFILTWIFVAVSCDNKDHIERKSATELLTRKEWILSGFGYDHNNNEMVDLSEESISECEKDNTYIFKINGTGIKFDNILSCTNGIEEQPFTWKFVNRETGMDLFFAIVKILRLTENEFIISTQPAGSNDDTRFLTVFRHE